MGNTCAGLNFSQSGEEASVQHKSLEQMKIPQPKNKQEQPPSFVQHKPLEQRKIHEPEKKQEQPPLSVQHKPFEHMKIPEPKKKQEEPSLYVQQKLLEQRKIPEPRMKQEQPLVFVQHKPLEQMKISEPKRKQEQRPLFVQHKASEQIKIPEPEKQEQELVKHKETKKVTSARLLTDSVLQRKNGHLKDFFILGEKIGQGKYGEVFLCKDKGSGELYACKSIAKTKLLIDDVVECVRRDIQIMYHLDGHPNVISIKGEYEDAVAVHLVMELCTGGDLYSRTITQRHYTERKVVELTRTIVGVVEACHSSGVMHRDLKLENFVFLDKGDNSLLKAIDFGLSVFFKPGESFHDLVGSLYYVAPEVLKRNYGPEVDVWSAGVIVYILLCSVPPFWAETEQGIFEQILHGDLDFSFDPWPIISDGAKDLVRKMLDRDPKRRLTAHEVLCHSWVQDDSRSPNKTLDSASYVMQYSALDKLKKLAHGEGNRTTDYGEFVTRTLNANNL